MVPGEWIGCWDGFIFTYLNLIFITMAKHIFAFYVQVVTRQT